MNQPEQQTSTPLYHSHGVRFDGFDGWRHRNRKITHSEATALLLLDIAETLASIRDHGIAQQSTQKVHDDGR